MIAERLIIAGRVQGVGYRDWLVAEASRRGLNGWVRNRKDGTVEAVLHGPEESVTDCITACWRGPSLAQVTAITRAACDPPAAGFLRAPTAAAYLTDQ